MHMSGRKSDTQLNIFWTFGLRYSPTRFEVHPRTARVTSATLRGLMSFVVALACDLSDQGPVKCLIVSCQEKSCCFRSSCSLQFLDQASLGLGIVRV